MKPFAQSLIISAAIVGIFSSGWFLGAKYTQQRIAEETIQYFSKGPAGFFGLPFSSSDYKKLPLSEDEKAEAELDEKFKAIKESIVKGEIR